MIKKRQKEKSKFKKLKSDFIGVCELRQLPKGTYFRVVDKMGKIGKTTYIKSEYDASTKKYFNQNCSDIWGNGRSLKGTQKVSTGFDY